ncbi:unnamed protein product [Mycena citricolor]|uniref:Uncharacterized protein n=1 Tax=Mycena citricolor TaxID=2018698 RepID=A0AAD2HS13_9AGAR|nr:unnamed protein product [Mycena citricolor]
MTLGPTSTASDAVEALSSQIQGKNVLVTGTTIGGLGFETARSIAKYANLVIITGYNDARLKAAADAIKQEFPGTGVRTLKLDLTSFEDVRRAAAEVLIHNACAPFGPLVLTPDKLERQMQVAYISPFLFTKLVKDKLLAAKTETYVPRVVVLGSLAHKMGKGEIKLDGLAAPLESEYDAHGRYQEAKTADILFAGELSRRSRGSISGTTLHPGLILTKNFSPDSESWDTLKALGIMLEDGSVNPAVPKELFKSLEQGVATIVVAAFDPSLDAVPGAYLEDCVIAPTSPAEFATDPDIAAKLWVKTEEILGEKFVF